MLPNGNWFVARASLESVGMSGTEAWRGSLTSEDPRTLWDVMTAGRAQLRLSDGWTGEFGSPRLEGADGRTLRVMGYGPTPF
jgi:hypothetical protein